KTKQTVENRAAKVILAIGPCGVPMKLGVSGEDLQMLVTPPVPDDWKCTNCGVIRDPAKVFCTTCGTPYPKKERSRFGYCTECGLGRGAERAPFCSDCGSDFSKQSPKKFDPQKVQVFNLQARDCSQCGASVPAGKLFCTECGAKQVEEEEERCWNCASPHAPGQKFCAVCGENL